MNALLAAFVLSPAVWSDALAHELRALPCDEPRDVVASLEADVKAGTASVAAIESETGERVGYVVYSVYGRELVVNAAFGRARENLTAGIIGLMDGIARERGCNVIGFHTLRMGLVKKAMACGFHLSSVCLRKAVA